MFYFSFDNKILIKAPTRLVGEVKANQHHYVSKTQATQRRAEAVMLNCESMLTTLAPEATDETLALLISPPKAVINTLNTIGPCGRLASLTSQMCLQY